MEGSVLRGGSGHVAVSAVSWAVSEDVEEARVWKEGRDGAGSWV